MNLPLKVWILLEVTLVLVSYGAIMPPPWADPKLNPCAKEPLGWQRLYWPPDGKCYKIFQLGPPCPEGMELSPAKSKGGNELYAECRCPPKQALSDTDGKCYPLFNLGPCDIGSYFAPKNVYKNNVTTSNEQIGTCKEIPECSNTNAIYWVRSGKCFQKLTRGPCPKGQLLTVDDNGISTCACNKLKEMKQFRAADDKCYQHFTTGYCRERGHLFLPDQTCGCWNFLPHFHRESQRCYELGTIGPCSRGEMFTVLPKTNSGGCMCRPGNIRYRNNDACHRPFTRGPCEWNQILVNSTTCIPLPCRRGDLYFPGNAFCYKIGSRGPCEKGKVVIFDFETRPSVDGISYNGVCACPTKNCPDVGRLECDRTKGLIRYGEKCFKLYSQGPCSKGEWLSPAREGKELLTEEDKDEGVCECIPGNIQRLKTVGNELLKECLPQTAVLAEFLNRTFGKTEMIETNV
ncbi:uncharacterized protein [Euwallacea fornicatus]|uniref:uncharacterized protein isoform X1 n=2 Tax=Euwallacea fornicatus TaxID=995702 RepID=UPI00338FADCC